MMVSATELIEVALRWLALHHAPPPHPPPPFLGAGVRGRAWACVRARRDRAQLGAARRGTSEPEFQVYA